MQVLLKLSPVMLTLATKRMHTDELIIYLRRHTKSKAAIRRLTLLVD
jgi:hypothetical protein